MTRLRWMGLFFAAGSVCFLVGPFPGYADLVGGSAVAGTFFAGSVLFSIGGALQSWLAWPDRREWAAGRAAWRTAIVQFVGCLSFNATTLYAIHVTVSSAQYDRLVWRPDAFGSFLFVVSGVIAYVSSDRRGWFPAVGARGWWESSVNLLGCILFGVSAIAGYVVPARGSIADLAVANWNTSLGAACFLACAVGALLTGRTSKLPHRGELGVLEREAVRDVHRLAER